MDIIKEKTDSFDNLKLGAEVEFAELRASLNKDFARKASYAAHEIHNPLSSMELHSKVIAKKLENLEVEDNSIKNSIGYILNSIEVLKSVVSELKCFSKDCNLQIEQNNLMQTAIQAIEAIRPSFEQKGVALNIYFKNEIELRFDKNKTYQVIFNLLKNALEATNKGQVDVYFVELPSEVKMLVKDTGCGVEDAHIEKIFLPDFTTKKTGTGVGLFESQKIARAQKGELKLVATGRGGSVFEFSFSK